MVSVVHPKIVQERLWHGSIQITIDTYSHVTPGLQQAAAVFYQACFTRRGLAVRGLHGLPELNFESETAQLGRFFLFGDIFQHRDLWSRLYFSLYYVGLCREFERYLLLASP